MSTLDDLFIKAKDLASAAGSKAQEMAELAKLRLQAAQLRSDMDANYLKMGEIIYELKKAKTDNEDLIAMCIAEIESQHKELDELNAKINELKNEVKCPECMAANPISALYCSRCGASLLPAAKEEEPEMPEGMPVLAEPAEEPTEEPLEQEAPTEEQAQ